MGIQTVGIIGLGALGVLFGHRLRLAGADVRIIADEQRAERYRAEGIFCNGEIEDLCYVTPAKAEPVDLLIFATKIGGLKEAMETAAPFVAEDTLLISLLNGVTSEGMLVQRFGASRVIYCSAMAMDAVKIGNKLVYTHPGMLMIGEREPGGITTRVQQLADFLNAHAVHVKPVPDMVRRQWGKLMLNVGVNQAAMVFECGYGGVQKPGKPREVMIGAMREAQQLANLEGYSITDAEFDEWLAMIDGLSPDGEPSMRQDGLMRRKSEVELFAGTVVRLAKKYDLPVPVNRWLYTRVKEMEDTYAVKEG